MSSPVVNIQLNCPVLNQDVPNASTFKPLESPELIAAILAEIDDCDFTHFKNSTFLEMPQGVLTILSLFSGPFDYGFSKSLNPSIGLQKELLDFIKTTKIWMGIDTKNIEVKKICFLGGTFLKRALGAMQKISPRLQFFDACHNLQSPGFSARFSWSNSGFF